MNLLQTTLITKAGYDSGFENNEEQHDRAVLLSSARHATLLRVANDTGKYHVELIQAPPGLATELQREFTRAGTSSSFSCAGEPQLYRFLSRAASLSRVLPTQLLSDYQRELAIELEDLPPSLRGTEFERLVRERVGQDRYRQALMDYWGGGCAVTCLTEPALLRASHARPWAECDSDAERLDVFNGLLLAAHLDALFDRFLISFAGDGGILLSPQLDLSSLAAIGITPALRLRWVDPRHEPYLGWHRNRLALPDARRQYPAEPRPGAALTLNDGAGQA